MSRKIIIAQFALLCFIHRNFTIIIFSLLFILTQSRKNTTLFQKNGLSLENRKDLWRQNRQQEQASFSPIRCLKFSHKNCLESWGPTMVWGWYILWCRSDLVARLQSICKILANCTLQQQLSAYLANCTFWLVVPLTAALCTSSTTTLYLLRHNLPISATLAAAFSTKTTCLLRISPRATITTFGSMWQTLAAYATYFWNFWQLFTTFDSF